MVLRRLVGTERVDYSVLLRKPYLPKNYASVDPLAGGRPWLWTDPPPGMVGGYGDPDSYQLAGQDSPVWQAPGKVLDDASSLSESERNHYRRHSVDLTMRGGATSGVVYPLAVCEVATKFRVRNVGGASELGRSDPLPPDAYAPLSEEDQAKGSVRPGFVGMADTVSWLAQVSPTAPNPNATSTASPSSSAPRDRRVFAIATALMRQRPWAVPLVALLAFGWFSKLHRPLEHLVGQRLGAEDFPSLNPPAT